MTVGSLFSGIGGFELAFEAAGFDVAFQVEIDPFCLKVLEKHWPTVPRFTDVTNCRGAIGSSADSHARTCHPPASALDSPGNAQGSTKSSCDLSASSGRAASSLKTSTTPGGNGCPSCGAPCSRMGMPLCRFECAPVILGPGMNEAASSLWPTLIHQSYGSNVGGGAGRTGPKRLSLPTLIRRDSRTTKGAARMPNSVGTEPLAVILPTLTVCGNYNRKGASPTSGDGLATAVGGRLNPTWCEWFMGFPLGWTDVAWPPASLPSVTPSSRRKSYGSPNGSKKRKPRANQ